MARDYFPEIALVSEVAIRQAIVYAYRTLGIMCEASAAPALAALLDDASAIRGRRTVVVVSGGNIEPRLLDQLLTGAPPSASRSARLDGSALHEPSFGPAVLRRRRPSAPARTRAPARAARSRARSGRRPASCARPRRGPGPRMSRR